jgi:arsenate reductase
MALNYYGYAACGTCRKAKQYLAKKKIAFSETDIVQNPPSKALLKALLQQGYALKDLFNKSGQLYRQLNMSERLKSLSTEAALDLLTQHGKLVKRPIITDGKRSTVGFDEAVFKQVWG